METQRNVSGDVHRIKKYLEFRDKNSFYGKEYLHKQIVQEAKIRMETYKGKSHVFELTITWHYIQTKKTVCLEDILSVMKTLLKKPNDPDRKIG